MPPFLYGVLAPSGGWTFVLTLLLGGPVWATSGISVVAQGASFPDTLQVSLEESLLGAVVQTRGIAATFAPDHFIHASNPEVTLLLDPNRPTEASFYARIPVLDLVVDDPEVQGRVGRRLVDLGILAGEYDEMSDRDRERVRSSMLASDQLHGEEYPKVEVRSGAISSRDDPDFPWTVDVEVTIRERMVNVPFRAHLTVEEDRVRVEAYGELRFTDFGIDPYRAFLGAIRNRDEFHLYLDLTATRLGRNGPPR